MTTLKEQIDFTNLNYAYVDVDVNSALGYIVIADDTGENEDIFLQGEDASNFIEERNRIWEEVGTVVRPEVDRFLAKPYVDNIWS